MNAKEEKEPKGLSTIIGIIALVLVGSRFLNEFGVQVDTGMVCMILAGIMVLLIGVRSWKNHRIWA